MPFPENRPVFDRAACLQTIANLAHPDGGWGYSLGQPAHLEPTCLTLLALSLEPEKYEPLIRRGLEALERNAAPDGSYRLERGRPQAVWPTPLVIFTRSALGHSIDQLQHHVERLLAIQGRVVKADPEVADMMDIDLNRIGWPWALNTFSWVEPTAWAVLALRQIGLGPSERAAEGARLLLDRAFEQGGINYGNRLILGKLTDPIPTPTALMLLALQGHGDHPRLGAAKSYLRRSIERTQDLEHLSWAKLALSLDPADTDTRDFLAKLDERLARSYAEQTADGRPVSTVRHALPALALSSDAKNPFRLPGERAKPVPLAETAPVEAKSGEGNGRGVIERLKSFVRGVWVRGTEALRQPPRCAAIHIAAADSYDVELTAILRKQFEHFRPFLPPMSGGRVVLKPNLVEWHRDKVINTDPRFVGAVIELCKAEGAAEVIVAEGPGHWRNVEFLVEESGLGEVLRKHGVRFVDLNHDEPVKRLNQGRTTGLEYLYLTRTITTADVFISLPKLKTHHWAGATLSLKNLFGTLPGICYGWPKNELHWRGIPNSIIDIALTQTPHLAIVDGITAMEGDGPLNGKARHLGVIVMGVDLVAVDATCCRLIGLPPERVPTLMLGAHKKLGRLFEAQIEQIGEPIAKFAQQFEMPPKIETMLMPVPAVGSKQ
jgi:uncharacterized protein (DUF362 family)